MVALSGRTGPLNIWVLACFGTCIGIGVLAGVNPQYGLIGALGLMFAVITIMDVTLGFVLFTIASFLDLFTSGGSFTGTKVIGLVLFGSWLARSATKPTAGEAGSFVRRNPWLVVALVAMLGWSALSVAWAESPSTALGGTARYALNMMLLPIAFAAIRDRRQLGWVLGAYAAGATLSALYAFAGFGATVDTRLTGSIGDPNAEATVCAASIVLVTGLMLMNRRSARVKLLGPIVVTILFAGLVTTLSREGILALAAGLVGAVVFGGRWRRGAAVLLVVGAVATIGYYSVLASPAARERVTNPDTSGRTSLWTVAWRVVKAHPVLGVGNDNFILVEGRYVNQPGSVLAVYTITSPHVVHDAYLEALADLGVPGLLTLTLVLAAALSAGVRAVRIFERLGDAQMELISRAVVLSLVSVLTAEVFVSSQYAKYLWLLIALCPALLGLARRTAAQVEAP